MYNGWKSSTQGTDLEFNKDNICYIVAIKSGPNWGNNSQIRKMQDDFRKAKQTIRTSNSQLYVVAVNGCCYGRTVNPDKGDYFKYCGQKFWEFISGNPDLYLKIIKPLDIHRESICLEDVLTFLCSRSRNLHRGMVLIMDRWSVRRVKTLRRYLEAHSQTVHVKWLALPARLTLTRRSGFGTRASILIWLTRHPKT